MVCVAPRMGRVSRNGQEKYDALQREVAPRMGRVSRNNSNTEAGNKRVGRAPHGACE